MGNINQTNETMKRIAAKQKLGLPLTEHEQAMWTLYGDTTEQDAKAAPTARVDKASGSDRTAVHITININLNGSDNIDGDIYDQLQEVYDALATRLDKIINATCGGAK